MYAVEFGRKICLFGNMESGGGRVVEGEYLYSGNGYEKDRSGIPGSGG